MDLKNPAGIYEAPSRYNREEFQAKVKEIEAFPDALKKTVMSLSSSQLNTLTLPGNWTVAQVVHHLADSHMNALIRLKLALTEDKPVIKPYDESAWARLADGKSTDLSSSISILQGVHHRMATVFREMDEASAHRTFRHPEMNREVPAFEIAYSYGWHGRHHLAHIELLRRDRGW